MPVLKIGFQQLIRLNGLLRLHTSRVLAPAGRWSLPTSGDLSGSCWKGGRQNSDGDGDGTNNRLYDCLRGNRVWRLNWSLALAHLGMTVPPVRLPYSTITYLVGVLEHFLFLHISGIIIPTDYFSEGLKPPTRYWLAQNLKSCGFQGSLGSVKNPS